MIFELPGIVVVVVAGAIAVAVTVLRAAWNSEHSRHARLQSWARRRGWSHTDRDDTFFEGFAGDPFGTGKARKATDVMIGTVGDRRAVVFGYQYTEATPDGSSTRFFRVIALSMPCAVGHLAVLPQGLFAKLGTKPGYADVQLANDAFNSAFRVNASSQKLADDLLPPRNIDMLLDLPDTDLRTEHDLLVAIASGPLTVRHIESTLALLATFLDNVPSAVWDDHDLDNPLLGPPAPAPSSSVRRPSASGWLFDIADRRPTPNP